MKDSKRSALLSVIALMLLLSPCVMYSSVYIWARATHKLVRYSGGFIARPNAMSGWGFTTWELVFAPLTWAEEQVRSPFTATRSTHRIGWLARTDSATLAP